MRVSSRDESDKDAAGSPKGEKLGSEKHHHDGLANEGLSPDILGKRLDAIGVNSVYERKVYILNRVMDEHIGMGKFQWQLFLLSGFGWFVDNMWLQGVAIILPRVRAEFGSSTPVSWMTFGLYVGLIIGAAGWGVLADIIGRRPAFNATLFLAGVFGIAAGAAPSYVGLGGLLAALGVGLGGNLPVDGMLFLEFIPGNKQYLLTLLSVFWSLGQLFASLIAWAFIANYSCEGDNSNIAEFGPCVGNNAGWRYTFYTLGAVTFAMFFARFAIFQLPESPKFLLSEGRDAEAVAVVKEIAARNGRPLDDDILSVAILRSAAGEDESMDANNEVVAHEKRGLAGIVDMPKQLFNAMRRIRPSTFKPDLRLVRPLFSSPKVAYNTSIIFILWAFIGLAYPLYNAFLPLFLERRGTTTGASDVNTVYSQYAYISICGVPGSIIAAFMVDIPRSGRRGAMAIGTLLTGVFVFVSTAAPNTGAFLTFLCLEALFQNIMYGVLYAYTPESFPAPVRGTGDGIASSLNRVFGLMAPIINIYGGASNINAPLYTSGALFIVCALLMLTLRIESQGKSAL
ncbi:MFS general substrate transporter [Tilletiopsis washingtonensis]|uniref:MFS general substrate transporter n=1 Tax=Tilletiopsis washingtonensis TaxID=58919 RepID=A0A316Z641_9BASI|nr:MFS general substrate transporter [Tilletiopsis washingtonensis]PWN96524.1 MFS general substrate transporter [Tilletiopsis washingtonensis]